MGAYVQDESMCSPGGCRADFEAFGVSAGAALMCGTSTKYCTIVPQIYPFGARAIALKCVLG